MSSTRESSKARPRKPSKPADASARDAGGGSPLHGQLRQSSYDEGAALLSPGGDAAPVQAYGGAVQKQDGSVDENVGEQARIQDLSLGFTIAAGRRLGYSSWEYEVQTGSDTQVTLQVSREGLRVYTNPALFIDAQWPAQNMRVYSAGINFESGQSYANVHLVGGLGSGFMDYTEKANTAITDMLDQGAAGTAMARPGYDAFSDDQIMQTLAAIKSNFENMPSSGGGSDVGAADIRRPSLSATMQMTSGFEQIQDGVGLRIASGGTFQARVVGDGNLEAMLAAGNAGEAVEAARVSSIGLTSESIELVKDGSPVVRLEQLTIRQGGRVSLGRFTLLGSGATAAGFESLIRLFAGIARYGAQGAPPELGARATVARGEAEPTLVRGMTRTQVEEGLTTAVQQLITENRNAIPGVDLAQALGVQ